MLHRKGGLNILLGAMVGRIPHQGGATWAALQYALGFRRLGHRVVVAESIASGDIRPLDTPIEESTNALYMQAAMGAAGLERDWSLLVSDSPASAGLKRSEVADFASSADLLVNLGGSLREPEVFGRIPTRVYVDMDPGFTQIWADGYGIDLGLDLHNHFFSYGHSLSDDRSDLPTCGKRWAATLPPVVLEEWNRQLLGGECWTTVANWRSYGTVEHQGIFYGQKAHSWRELFPLPSLANERFKIALAIDPAEEADLEALSLNGWDLLDPHVAAGTPARYREFVMTSKAELAIAKQGYVTASTGWFSDRSACYLAMGRPVVAQDTGFSRFLPTDCGLVAFSSLDEARDAVLEVCAGYDRHCSASVEVARQFFDSECVLNRILNAVGVPS